MARPRVFISSTFHNLNHVREHLGRFIEDLGFEPVLSEEGHVPYLPDLPLDRSCYLAIKECDLFVLIIGSRYGSPASRNHPDKKSQSDSITLIEYRTARKLDIPIHVLVDTKVRAEFDTFQRNRERQVDYAHADRKEVFELLDEVLGQDRNNASQSFQELSEAAEWLRQQWAGLFRFLLKSRSQQVELGTLQKEVSNLSQLNETLRLYLEKIMQQVGVSDGEGLIDRENERLDQVRKKSDLEFNPLVRFLESVCGMPAARTTEAIRQAPDLATLTRTLEDLANDDAQRREVAFYLGDGAIGREAVNDARRSLGLPPFT